MFVVETSHGPGVIGVTGGELARYHAFTMCWSGINVPRGTRGYFGLGYDTAYNSNGVIEQMVTHSEAEWVFVMDDDHVFAPDILLRLLDKQVDIVVPLYAQRQPPFHPCLYKQEHPDGSYSTFRWVDLEGCDGLLPVVSAGKGGVLLRRVVVEKLHKPWFERQGLIGEDHYFFKKAREAGFQPYAALDVPLGHLTTVEIHPHRNDRGWWCGKVDLKGNPPAVVEYWDKTYEERR